MKYGQQSRITRRRNSHVCGRRAGHVDRREHQRDHPARRAVEIELDRGEPQPVDAARRRAGEADEQVASGAREPVLSGLRIEPKARIERGAGQQIGAQQKARRHAIEPDRPAEPVEALVDRLAIDRMGRAQIVEHAVRSLGLPRRLRDRPAERHGEHAADDRKAPDEPVQEQRQRIPPTALMIARSPPSSLSQSQRGLAPLEPELNEN